MINTNVGLPGVLTIGFDKCITACQLQQVRLRVFTAAASYFCGPVVLILRPQLAMARPQLHIEIGATNGPKLLIKVQEYGLPRQGQCDLPGIGRTIQIIVIARQQVRLEAGLPG